MGVQPLTRPQWSPGRVDPIRLNLFFDLIYSISRSRNFENLGNVLGSQLRFLIDLDGFDLIFGDPKKESIKSVYSSSKELPRGSLVDLKNSDVVLTETLQICGLGRSPQDVGKILCYPLSTSKDLVGVFILKRDFLFDHSERRFAEAVGGFLAQMLDTFAMNTELLSLKDQLKKN